MEVGMVIAIEPMINLEKIDVLSDEWTVVTLSCHWEHSITKKKGTIILTDREDFSFYFFIFFNKIEFPLQK